MLITSSGWFLDWQSQPATVMARQISSNFYVPQTWKSCHWLVPEYQKHLRQKDVVTWGRQKYIYISAKWVESKINQRVLPNKRGDPLKLSQDHQSSSNGWKSQSCRSKSFKAPNMGLSNVLCKPNVCDCDIQKLVIRIWADKAKYIHSSMLHVLLLLLIE